MKKLGVLLLPLDGMLVPPQHEETKSIATLPGWHANLFQGSPTPRRIFLVSPNSRQYPFIHLGGGGGGGGREWDWFLF